MSEKVLGYFAIGGKAGKKKVIRTKKVSVVSVEWLEKYVTHIRGCFEKNQPSDFEAGEETGRIEGLEVLLAEAKKEAKKK